MNVDSVSQLWAVTNVSIFENSAENKNRFLGLTSQYFTGTREQFPFSSNFVRILLNRILPEPFVCRGNVVDTSVCRRSFPRWGSKTQQERPCYSFM